MAFLRLGLALPLALALAGCLGQAVNQAEIYKPVSGVLQLEVTVPAGESFSRVQFQINDEVLSEDTDGSDGFTAELDTADFAGEELVKLAAVGVRADGTDVVLRENYLRIEAAPAEDEGASEEETASE